MSAVPAPAAEPTRPRRLELVHLPLLDEAAAVPQATWLAIAAGALVLPWWGAVLFAPAVHVAGVRIGRSAAFPGWRSALATLAGAIAAWEAAHAVLSRIGSTRAEVALAGLTAVAAGLLGRRLLAGVAAEELPADAVWAVFGVLLGGLWRIDPWLLPFAFVPPLLISRSLALPRLQEEARLDVKTRLFNARHFGRVLEQELARSRRFGRPTSLIMADLDLLRETNNTYGHLAGDAVLRGVADIFRAQLRHYDVPARFGGEEFSILLPETSPEQALEIAERIRRTVAVRSFRSETSTQPLRATISMGVASFPRDADDVTQLIHRADLAVYRAKLDGRNRVIDALATAN